MLTKVSNGKRSISENIFLDAHAFKYAYVVHLLDELGVEGVEGFDPLDDTSCWYINGEVHGLPVHASFNQYEDLQLQVGDQKVSYNGSMNDTLNTFIETYRETWYEHHQDRRG